MKIFKHITLIICLISAFSCAVDESCRTNRSVLLQMDMYQITKNSTLNTITETAFNLDSVTVKGLKLDTINNKFSTLDSILYNNSKSISTINLPLHSFESSTIFELTFNSKKVRQNPVTNKNDTTRYINTKDTLTIYHKNMNDYLSLECGSIVIHSIDTAIVTNHFVDSIRISNHLVNNINAENIKIF